MSKLRAHKDAADPWLALFVVAITVLHLMSTLAKPLGEIGPTRWADWLDIPTPFLVVACVVLAINKTDPSSKLWLLVLGGTILYTEGHGIHLAGNSIGNFAPSATQYLWDEPVGHYLWYSGMWVLVAALFVAFAERERKRSPLAYGLAALFGFNAGLNAIEGGTVPLMLLASAIFIVWGWPYLRSMGLYWVVASAVCLLGLIGWGAYWGGYPQFSELGWI